MNSLFIAYKNKEWFHFVVRIGPPALFLFYCLCVVSFFFSPFSFLFFFFFVWSLLLAEVVRKACQYF